ncbi:uncharacterized protein N7515_004326 [Penicillium bovifimosum]|uniref:UBR-type domain-containing protein n=1 Tax=Penicillium bovifimosum TaxID=126998 RepID=A0A9W9L395_9EURO|nr:uncharacterized protein N7515_004326 [Penicillium bovifimosum]KAJ5135048.1 hypothetical protein N7515_004326 [Penicillium bovifimosum]
MDTPQSVGSVGSQGSQTAKEFIEAQLQLEADAREALPYAFDSCTYDLGPLRQNLFACLTCNPPPSNPDDPYSAAAVCYSCSISCHGEHELVELFNKRNFVCDCGTTRLPSSSYCTLREDPATGKKGVHSQKAAAGNAYNHNFRNRFCGCGEQYDPNTEKGTMFQCLGLGTVETGGCGEDWWHPECLVGLSRDWQKQFQKINPIGGGDAANDAVVEAEEGSLPPGFPEEDAFDHLICFKCIDSNPWIKPYAGTPGFLPPVFKEGGLKKISVLTEVSTDSKSRMTKFKESELNETDLKESKLKESDSPRKRKAVDEDATEGEPATKRTKEDEPFVEQEQPRNLKKEEGSAYSKTELTGLKEKGVSDTDIKNFETKELKTGTDSSKKRKADDEDQVEGEPVMKRTKEDGTSSKQEQPESLKEGEDLPKQGKDTHVRPSAPKHTELPTSLPTGSFSLFAQGDFYGQLCHCEECFPKLVPHPQLREEEDTYEPPLSDDGEGNGATSTGTGSIYDRGTAALNNMDRVRALEGAMAYNHLRDKLKSFLQPFAESGQAVSAEDVKGYFEKLRGDEQGIKDAADHASAVGGDSNDDKNGDKRNEQHGM